MIAILLLLPVFMDVQKYKPYIERRVSEVAGKPFTMGEKFNVFLFPWTGKPPPTFAEVRKNEYLSSPDKEVCYGDHKGHAYSFSSSIPGSNQSASLCPG